ncbi:hypothetical protein MPNT_30026 [Candidatus Methylacidithermus pantelleriae]|uniref:Uncharacterized protein n=1 Tax=Candidatus Methylacidithermus pantelleriae TaxID=2744239 RepID=A0A8J2BNI3_9BACT|nr:hypothetical protein MPNT_30026 [Candidatus Methylacidithermus pantelleriae]
MSARRPEKAKGINEFRVTFFSSGRMLAVLFLEKQAGTTNRIGSPQAVIPMPRETT